MKTIEVNDDEEAMIEVSRAMINSEKLDYFEWSIVRMFGTKRTVKTHWHKYKIYQFFGKMYA